MPPPSYNEYQATQQFVRGLNTMQMQAGLVPGGVPSMQMPMMQPMAHPQDLSRNLQVQFMQQQNIAQMTLPMPGMGGMSPIARPNFGYPGLNLPGQQFGYGGMARQSAIGQTNAQMGLMQAGLGLGARSMGQMGSLAMGGPLGVAAFEHFGGGQAMQNAGSFLMAPMIDQRRRALELQSMSTGFVHGGSDLSSSGMGLSMGAANRLSSGLGSMSSSSGFQRDTGGMFNKGDVMKITRLASQMGMLEQSQTADQIKDSVGKISRALAGFMKIAEEPDVQEAMRMMGQMRAVGLNLGESSMAARNARMFARMAGTSAREVLGAGMAGAGVYAQAGLSGGAGLTAGMAATGAAAALSSSLTPAQLAMAGGREGIGSTFMQASARQGISDMNMGAMLTRRNGRLAIDENAQEEINSGRLSPQQIAQMAQRNISRLGGVATIQELASRRRELQDEAQRSMGGTMQLLAPLLAAVTTMHGVPGMNLGAALRHNGASEQDARTMELAAQSPDFARNMMRQQEIADRENQRDLRGRMAQTERDARIPHGLRIAAQNVGHQVSGLTNAYENVGQDLFGNSQDNEEERQLSGGGRLVGFTRTSELDSDTQRASFRDRMRTRGGAARMRTIMASARARASRVALAMDAAGDEGTLGIGGMLGRHVLGPGGFGLSAAARGGEFMRDTVAANEGGLVGFALGNPLGQSLTAGHQPSGALVQARGHQMMEESAQFNFTSTHTNIQRDQLEARANSAARAAGLGTPEAAGRKLAVMTGAINKYLESRHSGFGAMVLGNNFNKAEMVHNVTQALIADGMSPAAAARLANDQAAQTQAISAGADSRTPGAQEVANHVQTAGAQVQAAFANKTNAQLVNMADSYRKAVLHEAGVETGTFSGTSRVEQRAILDAVSGAGVSGDQHRRMFEIIALEKAGHATQAAQMSATLRREMGGSRNFDELKAATGSSISGVSDATLRRSGERFSHLGTRGVARLNTQMDRDSATAQGAGATAGDDGHSRGGWTGAIADIGSSIASGKLKEALGVITGAATQGSQAPGATSGTATNFEDATRQYSEASQKMLEAAELMSGGREAHSVVGMVTKAEEVISSPWLFGGLHLGGGR